MRAPVNVRAPLCALLTVLAAGIADVCSQSWAQQSSHQSAGYRILFAPGSDMPLDTGEGGDHNRQAIARAARVLPLWSGQTGVRFVYVAPRSGVCSGRNPCNAEQLLWQRVNATTALIKQAAAHDSQQIPFNLIGMAFEEEFANVGGAQHEATAPAAGLSEMELRTYVAHGPPEGGCPWRASLADPDLPPVIGEPGNRSIPLTPNAMAGVGNEAAISLAAAGQEVQVAAIWETPAGEYCMAAPTLVAGQVTPIPHPPVRLHIVGLEDDGVSQFVKLLKGGCRGAVTPPRPFVSGKSTWPNITKGLGDNIGPLLPGELHPSPGKVAGPAYCQITFDAIAPAGRTSSR